MKKKIKILGLVAVLIVAVVVLGERNNQDVQGADMSLEVSSDHAKIGETVTLTVTVKSSNHIGSVDAYITYDSSALEFESADSDAVIGTSGTLHISEQMTESVAEVTYLIQMQALKTGDTKFNVGDVDIEDKDGVRVQKVKAATENVKVVENEEADSDCTLSQLLIAPGVLSEEFDPERTEYQVTVNSTVDELILSAIPTTEESVVTVDQPDKLVVGENLITITVTASSGMTKDYQIKVYKEK